MKPRFGLPEPITRERKDGGLGVPGAKGTTGAAGVDGTPGTNGADGTPGTPGTPGNDGSPGTPGTNGTPGSDGAPGQKDSIIPTNLGYFAFACLEATRPWLIDMVEHGMEVNSFFLAAVDLGTLQRFKSTSGEKDIVIGLRRDRTNWFVPARSKDQYEKNQKWIKEGC